MIALPNTRFGLIGAGGIAQAYMQAFQDSDTAELAAVADVRPDAAEAIAQAVGCKAFTAYRSMCDEMQLDAVVVCTPPVTHPDICADLFRRQLHVLCEKPLAISSESARGMIAAADAAGVTFTMASKFRYVNDVIRAKALVTSGTIGDVVLFENAFTARVDMSSRWNSNPEVSGGGVLIDNGTHSVDIMRYFLGPLAELQVVEGKRIQNLPVEDTVRMFVKSEGGVMGSIDLSWSINKELPTYISIFGSQGTIQVGWKESKYRRSTDNEWTVFGDGYNKFQAFGSQIDNFSKAIRGDEELLINSADGLASVEAIESAYSHLKRSAWEPIAAGNGDVEQHA